MTSQDLRITIRHAAPLEAANIVRLLKSHWSEQGGLRPERVNDTKALTHVLDVINLGRVVVAERAGRLVGVAGSRAVEESWSDDWFMNLLWLYTVPFNSKVSTGEMEPEAALALRRETEQSLLAEVEVFADLSQLPLRADVFAIKPVNPDHIFTSRRYLRMGGVFIRMPSEEMVQGAVAAAG